MPLLDKNKACPLLIRPLSARKKNVFDGNASTLLIVHISAA